MNIKIARVHFMIIVIHGPAGSGKSTACKRLVKGHFQNRAAYYDIDHVTQSGTQAQRCQQIVNMIGNHDSLYQDFHYFINWVFETPKVVFDFMEKLGHLNAQQEVKGLIITARHEVRMERLKNRPDREKEQSESEITAKSIEDHKLTWAVMGPTIDTSDSPEEVIARKISTLLKLS
jgi:dephospho-CoA kinase